MERTFPKRLLNPFVLRLLMRTQESQGAGASPGATPATLASFFHLDSP
jgi:hypothetical protein